MTRAENNCFAMTGQIADHNQFCSVIKQFWLVIHMHIQQGKLKQNIIHKIIQRE